MEQCKICGKRLDFDDMEITYCHGCSSKMGSATATLQKEVRRLRRELRKIKTAPLPTNEEIAEALEPFAQAGFSRILAGNVEGDESIIFERDGCKLRLGDFRRATAALDKVRKI